jgi:ribosome-binding ATPase YchF (GTP1/OBG family)
MRIGIVGYQGTGKSTIFELLTGVKPDHAKSHVGQVGVTVVPDDRFNGLVKHWKPKKETPAKIELFDTPGLSRSEPETNPQKLNVIRESTALVHVVGAFLGQDPVAEAQSFVEDIILADLQMISNRIDRLKKEVAKPVPNRAQLQAELDSLVPIEEKLSGGSTLHDMPFNEEQEKATRSFSLLSKKKHLVLLNTADSSVDQAVVKKIEDLGYMVVAGPLGLELEVAQLPEEDRALFAEEMGLTHSAKEDVVKAIFKLTDRITFYTSDEKEVHAWLLKRGLNAVEAAGTIHSDLARGFIRAEVMSVDDLMRLGSEKEVKAAGLYRIEGKDYVVQDGDEIVVRFSV